MQRAREGPFQADMTEIAHIVRTAPLSFMNWWLSELASFLPSWLTSGRDRPRTALILDVDHDGAVLTARKPRDIKTLGRTGGDAGVDGLSALGERRYRRWPLIVRLGADLGMRKVVDLPLQARNELANLLHFELDRLTPFSPEEVCFTWRVIETDQPAGRMKVALEMAPKGLVERALDIAAEHGRSVDRMEIQGDGEQEPLDLLSSTTRAEPAGRFAYILPLIVLVLAIVAVWVPLSRQQSAVDRLTGQVETRKSAAEEALALRQELDAGTRKAGFLIDAKNGRASMTRVLAELTKLLPDHGHIVQLDIRDDEIQLNGFADRASDLLTILDRSAMFTSPSFTSAVTRDPRLDKERFQITVQLEGARS